jgi:hypothetical protein
MRTFILIVGITAALIGSILVYQPPKGIDGWLLALVAGNQEAGY